MFQAVNQPLDAFLMSVSRQGVVFAVVIFIMASVMGYQGVIVSQPIADVITAIIGLGLYYHEFGPKGESGCKLVNETECENKRLRKWRIRRRQRNSGF